MEEFLTGPEVSVLAFTDGETLIPMISSMDHKRALDGDRGLNTGGMGTIAPNPYYTEAVAQECMEKIFLPTIRAMQAEGRPFKGCLYFGLMLTADGPKVIEYNCRFGDPETQVVLPLLETDLLTVMEAVHDGTLSQVPVEFSKDSACCVILASNGYPENMKQAFQLLCQNIWMLRYSLQEQNCRTEYCAAPADECLASLPEHLICRKQFMTHMHRLVKLLLQMHTAAEI